MDDIFESNKILILKDIYKPIHLAAAKGNITAISELISNGIDIKENIKISPITKDQIYTPPIESFPDLSPNPNIPGIQICAQPEFGQKNYKKAEGCITPLESIKVKKEQDKLREEIKMADCIIHTRDIINLQL